MSKKVLIGLLALTLVFCIAPIHAFAEGGSISIDFGSASGVVTDTESEISVPVSITQSDGFSTIDIDISWDETQLELVRIDYNAIPDNNSASITTSTNERARYRICLGSPLGYSNHNYDCTGSLCSIVFRPISTSTVGEKTITVTEVMVYNIDDEEVNANINNGKVNLNESESAKYTVNPVSTPNGKVTADKKTAEKGETVTLTATSADERYKVDEVTVVDGNGKPIQLTDNGDGTYSFSMPASGVTVRAVFAAKDNAKFKTTVKDCENGSATAKPNSAKVGETVTVTTKPDDGYGIDTVKVEDSNGKSISIKEQDNGIFTFVQPDGDVTVEVTFKTANHSISIEEPKHGAVSVTPKDITIGEEVTITATPDEGYEVDFVTVRDAAGNKVRVTNNSDGTYSFKMPDGGGRVIVTFKEINCPSTPFKDLDTSLWYHEGVDYVIAKGLMNGIASDMFDPTGHLNRAMLVTILYRLEGQPEVSGENPYADVKKGSWYDNAVNWASGKSIVNGYGNGEFGPTDDITREQMAAMIMRYAEFKGLDTGKRAELTSFSDAGAVSRWAMDNMKWAVAEGLIKGSCGKLMPLDPTNRAEAATILMRFIEGAK